MHFRLNDSQISSRHLLSLGAENIKRNDFLCELKIGLENTESTNDWQLDIPARMLA